jgi:DNA/RNA-binding domain of Phe-tRNA-synthetase-like protein
VIFADQARHVHARRWTSRQSGLSALQDSTAAVLVVADAMHDRASSDVPQLIAAIADELNAIWSTTPVTTVLRQSEPRFTFRM